MHRFKNNMSDGYLFSRELQFFRNFATNWDRDVEDCDFFDIFSNSANVSSETAVQMFSKYFKIWEIEGIPRLQIDFKEVDGVKKMSVSVNNVDDVIRDLWNIRRYRERCRRMVIEWTRRMERKKNRKRPLKDPFETRFEEVCRTLHLNETEADVLAYAAVRTITCFDDFPSRQCHGRNSKATFVAMAVDRPVGVVTAALTSGGRLRRFGILDSSGDLPSSSAFCQYLEEGAGDALADSFYSVLKTDDALPWSYFGALAETHGAILKRMVSADRGKRGLNILLYGAPGTGKSSFVRALAHELGRTVYEIRQGEAGEKNFTPESRIAGIQICNDQVPPENSLVLVDEADQLLRTRNDFFSMFGSGRPGGADKGVINSVLDEVRLPTIWVSNAPAGAMDDSVRRRFDYSICFRELNVEQRRAIWRNSVEKMRLGSLISEEMANTLAGKYQTNARRHRHGAS